MTTIFWSLTNVKISSWRFPWWFSWWWSSDDSRDDVRWRFPFGVLFYPGWWRSLPRCLPRPIPFPRGSSVFLMGIVYTFGTRLKRGGAGHGGVRPRHPSYPTWTIYIPPTIWRFPFGDVHYTWVHDNSHSPRWFSFPTLTIPLTMIFVDFRFGVNNN